MICAAWPDEVQTAPTPPSSVGEALGEGHDGGVGQAGVDVADFLQVEERGGVVGVAEHVGGVLVDRRLPRPGRRVRPGAGVNLQRVEAVWHVGHGLPSVGFGGRLCEAGTADNLGNPSGCRLRAARPSLHAIRCEGAAECPMSRLSPSARRSIRASTRPSRGSPQRRSPGCAASAAARSYRDGEALIEAGTPGPGMFIVLRGQVAISQRDGFGQRQPLVEQGPGQFIAEVGQLSGRLALVDGYAEGDVDTILIPPAGLEGAADRRGDARRADHPGADPAAGAADPGRARRAADHRRSRRRRRAPARHLPRRNGHPHKVSDPDGRSGGGGAARALHRGDQGAAGGDHPLGKRAAQSDDRRPRAGARARRPRAGARALRRGGGGRRAGRAVGGRLCRLRGAVGRGDRRHRLRRAGRGERAHRELPRLPDRDQRRRR